MNISVNSGSSTINKTEYNTPSILIMGKGASDNHAREIVAINSEAKALDLYGSSDLSEAYSLLESFGVTNVFMANCYNETDYFRTLDQLLHYDFNYIIPISIYLGDKYYNPLTDIEEYYAEYFLNKLKNTLSTVIFTERHASLYKDFDEYIITMRKLQLHFFNEMKIRKSGTLNSSGNNLNFVLNNISAVPYSNVILGALYCTRNTSQYFNAVKQYSVVYHINKVDIADRTMYFKFNHYGNNITIENAYNFKTVKDIQANAMIDDTVKRVTRALDMSEFKGKLYTPHVALQIETKASKILKTLKGSLVKSYNVNKIYFKKDAATAGYIILDISIIPYGTLEKINIIRGVN